jgi:hypothetical protein
MLYHFTALSSTATIPLNDSFKHLETGPPKKEKTIDTLPVSVLA